MYMYLHDCICVSQHSHSSKIFSFLIHEHKDLATAPYCKIPPDLALYSN